MLNPKFIIEDGNLILSKVVYHKDMVTDMSKVKGGGWFKFDSENKMFTLYGSSDDFGRANIRDIQNCVKSNRVFTNHSLTHDISKQYTFQYEVDGSIILLP